ncbi:MAG: CHAT domain-containing protein, partial [Okeania sp. SIO2D1]|nr:CHAT domain-containing protein [Okeania sp. SIO2D1]
MMMRTFYHILSQEKGLTRAQILQEAQLAMLEGRAIIEERNFVYQPKASVENPNPEVIIKPLPGNILDVGKDLTHPYYWSAFELLGNPY